MEPKKEIEFAGKNILVVDDSIVARKVISALLQKHFFKVTQACSGDEALSIIRHGRPDLIMLDVNLGDMNGFEVCRCIKESSKTQDVPVIYLTAEKDTTAMETGFNCGGSDYLTKPFNPVEAISRIKLHLRMAELVRMQDNFIDALQNSNQSKVKLIGMASHDLRGPLGSISGLAEFLQDGELGKLNEDQLDVISSIKDASEKMLALVEDLLDLSVIERENVELHYEPTDLKQVIDKSVRLQTPNAKRKAITLNIRADELPQAVLCDGQQIGRVVDNLISNAIKYSPKNTQVYIRLEPYQDRAVIHVDDEGPGIPDEDLPRMFEEFGTTSVKPTGDEKSVGLGLMICKKIVHAHHGRIWVYNRPEGGCRFTVDLPFQPSINSSEEA